MVKNKSDIGANSDIAYLLFFVFYIEMNAALSQTDNSFKSIALFKIYTLYIELTGKCITCTPADVSRIVRILRSFLCCIVEGTVYSIFNKTTEFVVCIADGISVIDGEIHKVGDFFNSENRLENRYNEKLRNRCS